MAWYKENVLWKVGLHAELCRGARSASVCSLQIEKAFAAGYDPALELAKNAIKKPAETTESSSAESLDWDLEGPWTQHLRRAEQDLIDRIIQGKEVGHYFILLGPKVRVCAFCSVLGVGRLNPTSTLIIAYFLTRAGSPRLVTCEMCIGHGKDDNDPRRDAGRAGRRRRDVRCAS